MRIHFPLEEETTIISQVILSEGEISREDNLFYMIFLGMEVGHQVILIMFILIYLYQHYIIIVWTFVHWSLEKVIL